MNCNPAKSRGRTIDDAANQGTGWVALTNGAIWRVYKVAFARPTERELVVEGRPSTICYLAALMSKKFTKRKTPATDPAAATPEQQLLERQRFLAARTLRKRRRRKSHQ